ASLLAAHPEYCYLGWCDDADEMGYTETFSTIDYTSEDFDNALLAIDNYDDASNIVGSNEFGGNLLDLSFLYANDPFFTSTASGFLPSVATRKMPFNTAYTFSGPTAVTMLQLAIYLEVHAPNYFGTEPVSPDPITTIGTITSGYTPQQQDDIWNRFKMMYIGKKQEFYRNWAHEYAVDAGCYNGCIGAQPFNPFEYGFASSGSGGSGAPG